MSQATILKTKVGSVEGEARSAASLSFRDIPYASAPIGNLRFRPPEPAMPWQGVLRPRPESNIAPQTQTPDLKGQVSEDCLHLNVTIPANKGRNRPVIVYIHGGAFIAGSGNARQYDGAHLTDRHDVVFVSINYRLGIFGFPPFDVFGEDQPRNIGILDQVAALNWIKENIAEFGGDPDNVTVMGYSAGGWSIACLLALPCARDLIHKAILQSGAFMTARAASAQDLHSQIIFDHLGPDFSDAGDLLSLPVETLLDAQAQVIDEWQRGIARNQFEELEFPFAPMRDSLLVDHPLELIRKCQRQDISLLIGTTQDELGVNPFRMSLDWYAKAQTKDNMLAALSEMGSEEASLRLWAAYERIHPSLSEPMLVGKIRSDWLYRMPAVDFAEAWSDLELDTWMYRFDLPGRGKLQGNMACHASDTLMWLGSLDDAPSQYREFFHGEANGQVDAMSEKMMSDVFHFVSSGRCDWEEYESQQRITRCYAFPLSELNDPGRDERLAWAAFHSE